MRLPLAVLVLLLAAPAMADEKPVQLTKAPGLDKVEANCAACHSLDYIPMPTSVVDLIHEKWKSEIKDSSGKSLMN